MIALIKEPSPFNRQRALQKIIIKQNTESKRLIGSPSQLTQPQHNYTQSSEMVVGVGWVDRERLKELEKQESCHNIRSPKQAREAIQVEVPSTWLSKQDLNDNDTSGYGNMKEGKPAHKPYQ